MTAATSAALAFALSSYAKSETTPAVVIIRDDLTSQKLVKVTRTKATKAAKVTIKAAAIEPAPQSTNPSPNGGKPGLKLPLAGSIGAKAFIMAMNHSKSRDESICAIAAYTGYSIGGDFATQELAARAKAKGEICPVKVTGPSKEEQRSAARSAVGYVAGMPDNQRKLVQDLIGRENLAVSTRNEHVRTSRKHSLPMFQRKLAVGLARLEQERLAAIRADLAQYI